MMHTVQPSSPPAHGISRRLLRLGVLAAAVPCVSGPTLALGRTAQQCERSLDFYNVHTGESLTTVYWIKGTYVPTALRDINYVLWDHHSDQVKPIDLQRWWTATPSTNCWRRLCPRKQRLHSCRHKPPACHTKNSVQELRLYYIMR